MTTKSEKQQATLQAEINKRDGQLTWDSIYLLFAADYWEYPFDIISRKGRR